MTNLVLGTKIGQKVRDRFRWLWSPAEATREGWIKVPMWTSVSVRRIDCCDERGADVRSS